jgi:DNA mismatch repair protein MutH
MLMLFYKYEKEVPVTKRKFVLDPLLVGMGKPDFKTSTHDIKFITGNAMQIPEVDLSIFRADWEFIRDKVRQGKAHELSEGDTTYLGACRKGAGGAAETLREQPFSAEKAKARAFAIKQGYVTTLINGHISDTGLLAGKETMTLEDATASRFEPFVGRTLQQISTKVGVQVPHHQPKNYKRMLVDLILNSSGGSVAELRKADIELKTILLTPKGLPQEDMSFPSFNYSVIVNQHWEDSSFFERTERKFLFVVFQKDESQIVRLVGFRYWNMPPGDREEAQRVFEETKRRIKAGNHKLPSASESRVAHVRPKAANREDVGIFPDGTTDVKKCFWLNKTYIAGAIAGLQNP